MKEATLKYGLLKGTELGECPIQVLESGGVKTIRLADYPYGLEDHHKELMEGLYHIEQQLNSGNNAATYRGDNIILIYCEEVAP